MSISTQINRIINSIADQSDIISQIESVLEGKSTGGDTSSIKTVTVTIDNVVKLAEEYEIGTIVSLDIGSSINTLEVNAKLEDGTSINGAFNSNTTMLFRKDSNSSWSSISSAFRYINFVMPNSNLKIDIVSD